MKYLYIPFQSYGPNERPNLFGIIPLTEEVLKAVDGIIISACQNSPKGFYDMRFAADAYKEGVLHPMFWPMSDDDYNLPPDEFSVQVLDSTPEPLNFPEPALDDEEYVLVRFDKNCVDFEIKGHPDGDGYQSPEVPYEFFRKALKDGLSNIETTQHTRVKENNK